MKPLVFVDGDQGTTGLQIMARLGLRQDITVLTLPVQERKNAQLRVDAINDCDLAVLCLPDAAAREAVASVVNPKVRIIDASSAHRTDPSWIYGLPELGKTQALRIAQAKRVSNPGCYPTGAVALLKPLIDAGLVPSDYPITIHAVSGYSGRGRAGIEEHEPAEGHRGAKSVLPFQVYGLTLQHKHVPEIELHAGLVNRPIFIPSYGSFRQGIALTIPIHLRLLGSRVHPEDLRVCLEHHYAGAPKVKVLSEEEACQTERLDPQALNGTDDISLAVFHNHQHEQILLAAIFDNLGKGASGAAVQNLDLMLKQHREP